MGGLARIKPRGCNVQAALLATAVVGADMAKKKAVVHKLAQRAYGYPSGGSDCAACGRVFIFCTCHKNWAGVTCKSCLRSKPKGKP